MDAVSPTPYAIIPSSRSSRQLAVSSKPEK